MAKPRLGFGVLPSHHTSHTPYHSEREEEGDDREMGNGGDGGVWKVLSAALLTAVITIAISLFTFSDKLLSEAQVTAIARAEAKANPYYEERQLILDAGRRQDSAIERLAHSLEGLREEQRKAQTRAELTSAKLDEILSRLPK